MGVDCVCVVDVVALMISECFCTLKLVENTLSGLKSCCVWLRLVVYGLNVYELSPCNVGNIKHRHSNVKRSQMTINRTDKHRQSTSQNRVNIVTQS